MSEITIAKMQKDIDHINGNIVEIKEYIKEDQRWKEDFGKCLDKKYSGKWVETISLSALAGVGVGIVLLLLEKI